MADVFDRVERGWRGALRRAARIRGVRRQVAAALAPHLKQALPRVEVGLADRPLGPLDAVLRREGETLRIEIPAFRPMDLHRRYLRQRLAAHAWSFWQMGEDAEIMVACSDGHDTTLAPYGFCSAGSQVLLPDYYFFQTDGFAAERRDNARPVPWAEREDALVWRGGANGALLMSVDPALAGSPYLDQRLALVLRCRSGLADVGYVAGIRPNIDAALAAAGLMADRQPTGRWAARKFAIDVDGWTATWDNLPVRMLQGCCVLRVESRVGWRMWYHDRLRPWEHFVPVSADLSDLEERIDWVRTNDASAEQIAAAGRAVMEGLTWEAARAHARDRLTETRHDAAPIVPRA